MGVEGSGGDDEGKAGADLDTFDDGYGDPFREPMDQPRDAEESDGGRDEDARAGYLGLAEVLG